jgi:hypothetical protein
MERLEVPGFGIFGVPGCAIFWMDSGQECILRVLENRLLQFMN